MRVRKNIIKVGMLAHTCVHMHTHTHTHTHTHARHWRHLTKLFLPKNRIWIQWRNFCCQHRRKLLQRLKVKLLSRVQLFATPWTAAHQASPSMEFSRHEYYYSVRLNDFYDHCVLCLISTLLKWSMHSGHFLLVHHYILDEKDKLLFSS